MYDGCLCAMVVYVQWFLFGWLSMCDGCLYAMVVYLHSNTLSVTRSVSQALTRPQLFIFRYQFKNRMDESYPVPNHMETEVSGHAPSDQSASRILQSCVNKSNVH